MRNFRPIWLATTILLGCGGGGGDGGTGTTVSVNSVTVTPANPTVAELQTVQLTATARDGSGGTITGKTFAWASTAQTIATVGASTGLVSGVASGTAVISATTDGKTGQVTVTVTPVPSSVSITTTPDSLLAKGATVQLTAVVRDAGNNVIAGAPVTWSSNSATVATVDPATGLVTATVSGNTAASANITATAAPGVTSTVTVFARQKLASLLVAPATASVAAGSTQQVTATPRDANANSIAGSIGGASGATFSSSNAAAATVNPTTGLVTTGAGAAGTSTTILASLTADGATRTGTSLISVTAAFPLTATVNTSGTSFVPSTPVDIKIGGTVTFNLSGLPHSVLFSGAGAPTNISQCTDCSDARTFSTAGTITFICGVHGAGMSGSIRVNP